MNEVLPVDELTDSKYGRESGVLTKPKAPPSAFLLYCKSIREDVKLQLQQNNSISKKVTLGDIQRQISENWKILPVEERKYFEEWASSLKNSYIAELKSRVSNTALLEERLKLEQEAFPISRLHRILKSNTAIKKISTEALMFVNQAIVLFLKHLIIEADRCRNGKNTGKLFLTKEDIVTAIRRGGLKLKFLQVSTYILDDEELEEGIDSLLKRNSTETFPGVGFDSILESDKTNSRSQRSTEIRELRRSQLMDARRKQNNFPLKPLIKKTSDKAKTAKSTESSIKRKHSFKHANIESFFAKTKR